VIRVLQCIGSLEFGGAQSFIMEVYRKIDRNAFQFDFVVFEGEVKLTVPEGIRSFTLTCEAVSGEKRDLNRYLFFVSAEGLPLCSADAVLKFVEAYKSENGIK